MSWRGIHPKGGFLSVWKVLLLTFLFAPITGANHDGAVHVVSTGDYDDDTRGVVLVFARSHELTSVLSTMHQLQHAHDNRFSKDWIFYSDEDISEEFKSLTSNLTLPGTAYYEKLTGHDDFSSIGYWNWPVLARNGRFRGYNWVWRISPGSNYSSIAKHVIGHGQRTSSIQHTRSNSLGTRCSKNNDQQHSMSISPMQSSHYYTASIGDDTLSLPKPQLEVLYIHGNPEDDISMIHRRWARIARDFEKQRKIPSLRAGRTTLFASSEMWDPYHHMNWAKSSDLPLFMGYI